MDSQATYLRQLHKHFEACEYEGCEELHCHASVYCQKHFKKMEKLNKEKILPPAIDISLINKRVRKPTLRIAPDIRLKAIKRLRKGESATIISRDMNLPTYIVHHYKALYLQRDPTR